MKKKYFIHPKAIVESKSIGKGTRIWAYAHIMKNAKIGSGCNIGDHCYIEGKSKIGNRVTIKNGVAIWEGIEIKDDVFVGPYAVFTNDLLPISKDHSKKYYLPIIIKKGACIGANATIVCGITVGEYAFVGAGSVVTKDIPDYALFYGNPARFCGFLCKCRNKLKFIKKIAKCSCKLKYKLIAKNKIKLIT